MVTVREACQHLRVSIPTLYKLINTRQLRPTKIGRATRISRRQLERLDGRRIRLPPNSQPSAVARRQREARAAAEARGGGTGEEGDVNDGSDGDGTDAGSG